MCCCDDCFECISPCWPVGNDSISSIRYEETNCEVRVSMSHVSLPAASPPIPAAGSPIVDEKRPWYAVSD